MLLLPAHKCRDSLRQALSEDCAQTCFSADDPIALLFVPGGNDSGIFKHQDHGTLGRSRSVEHTFRNHQALPRSEFDGPAFQVNQQLAFASATVKSSDNPSSASRLMMLNLF